MKIDQKLIDEGYINKIKHPTEELYLYNYSQKAQFEGMNSPLWKDHPELEWCRGLILNDKNEIIARPFRKFWNYEQYDNNGLPPYKSFQIFDKLDGSLGIVYPTSKGIAVATRGSFQSEQALWATEFLNNNHKDFCEKLFWEYQTKGKFLDTWLFEIIYPENRIVVHYNDFKGLIFLTAINNSMGNDWDFFFARSRAKEFGFEVVEKFDGIEDFTKIRDLIKRDNAEGFVILFNTGLRVKMKYEEYCRLHRIITGVSSKKIWEMLRAGDSFAEILELVPDEFHEWVNKVKNELEEKFNSIDTIVQLTCQTLSKIEDIQEDIDAKEVRKRQASVILRDYKPLSSAIFSELDGKNSKDIIWKMIEPKYEQPFKTGIEN